MSFNHRRSRALAAFALGLVAVAVLALGGCEMVLGTFDVAPDIDAGFTSETSTLDASVPEDATAPPLPPGLECKEGEKACGGACVRADDPAFGCGDGCSSCSLGPFATGAACEAATCKIASCESGRFDCNKDVTDGCETNIRTDPGNCGQCGKVCDATAPFCSDGDCVLTCPVGTTECSGACVDTTTDPEHCSACDNACAFGPNSTPTYNGSTCGLTCNMNFSRCGESDPTKGCPFNTTSDAKACGEKCVDCTASLPKGTVASCGSGTCNYSCTAGLHDCSTKTNKTDGCTCQIGDKVNPGPHHCTEKGTCCAKPKASCGADLPCCAGTCDRGTCSCKGSKSACLSDAECCSGSCVRGVCF
jgi:hypothetical protein